MAPSNNTNPSTQRPKVATIAQTYGKYDATAVRNQFWLARLPPTLAAHWEIAPEGTLLGHLTFTKGAKPQPSNLKTNKTPNQTTTSGSKPSSSGLLSKTKPVQQKLAIEVNEDTVTAEQSDLPLDYTLTNLTTKIPTLYPFSRGKHGKIDLHGKISRSCNLQMERSQRYREMCKSRLINAVAGEKRFVKPVQNAELARSNNVGSIGSGFGNSIALYGKKLLDDKNEINTGGGQKRKFDETQSVRSILFELFSQQRYWSVKELIAISGRAEKEIRLDLKVIADSKRTGEFKGLWELKSEFAGDVNKQE
jgi:transcription initiation factor TFIIF subunit beta